MAIWHKNVEETLDERIKHATDFESQPAEKKKTNQIDWIPLAMFNESLLEKEFRLGNDRINWTMTSQSLLLTAFCVLLTSRIKASPGSEEPQVVRFLLCFIPAVGAIIASAGFVGWSAATNCDSQTRNRKNFISEIAITTISYRIT